MAANPVNQRRTRLGLALHGVVAAVFFIASVPKLADPGAFADSIMNYRLVPWAAAAALAAWVPWMEVVSAAGLFIRRWRTASALWVGFFLVAFIGLHLSTAIRGLDLDCGCFGALSADTFAATWWFAASLNLLLLAFLIAGHRLRSAPA